MLRIVRLNKAPPVLLPQHILPCRDPLPGPPHPSWPSSAACGPSALQQSSTGRSPCRSSPFLLKTPGQRLQNAERGSGALAPRFSQPGPPLCPQSTSGPPCLRASALLTLPGCEQLGCATEAAEQSSKTAGVPASPAPSSVRAHHCPAASPRQGTGGLGRHRQRTKHKRLHGGRVQPCTAASSLQPPSLGFCLFREFPEASQLRSGGVGCQFKHNSRTMQGRPMRRRRAGLQGGHLKWDKESRFLEGCSSHLCDCRLQTLDSSQDGAPGSYCCHSNLMLLGRGPGHKVSNEQLLRVVKKRKKQKGQKWENSKN
ncbi:uncharacterized protein LOC124965291 [Sciurus carolinensis]|uniref:uncharacterized protein LOC124965291 n=1 Tax=Sciurus carolinensis TaxID=30640 RepID=UPI001FB3E4CB|nr:uncharacterized protein LOC124965291 [Sciurus carolinensis]XP_047382108.1 uncharacterized protein LOC124965291 [Sciurus carolinensis]XP_047382110.1 uncharacterized protein LOC124965291 [Sciurus carolinensis]XP_047382111.1 uncharacterized protein LOC124965291 [Sciurus carolinensis]XP_047382112.1 uncharacterized protein LOC124965291 [Sciurus carolinensis]XP_047382113.1 uncharacterized protein LOC124965291 [Sciurus carolinensis]